MVIKTKILHGRAYMILQFAIVSDNIFSKVNSKKPNEGRFTPLLALLLHCQVHRQPLRLQRCTVLSGSKLRHTYRIRSNTVLLTKPQKCASYTGIAQVWLTDAASCVHLWFSSLVSLQGKSITSAPLIYYEFPPTERERNI